MRLPNGDNSPARRSRNDAPGRCLYASALNALSIPFVVFDPHVALLSNPEWNELFADGTEPTGLDADLFLDPSNVEAGRLRRTHLFEQGISLDSVYVHSHSLSGTDHRLIVAIERVDFGNRQRGVLIVKRKVDDYVYSDFTPLTRFGRRRPHYGDVCIHDAVFESFPLPLLIVDARFVVAGNLQARLLLGEGLELAGMRTMDLIHADALDAAEQRRKLLFSEPGHLLRDVVVRLSIDKAGRHARIDTGSFDHYGDVYGISVIRDILP